MDGNFEQNHFLLITKGIYKKGHDSTRIFKWMAYFDEFYKNIIHFVLIASVHSTFKRNI